MVSSVAVLTLGTQHPNYLAIDPDDLGGFSHGINNMNTLKGDENEQSNAQKSSYTLHIMV